MNLRGLSIVLVSCILIASCGTIKGHNDGYRAMSNTDRQQVRPFDPSMGLDDEGDTLKSLYETTAAQLHSYMNDSAAINYVIVWVPWCHGPNCKPLSYYQNLRGKLAKQNINLFIVSDQYDIKEINQQRRQFRYDGKLFVMNHTNYGGQNRGKQVKQFLGELLNMPKLPDSLAYESFYLFKGRTLYKHGTDAVQYLEKL